jgi:hypothetical protein
MSDSKFASNSVKPANRETDEDFIIYFFQQQSLQEMPQNQNNFRGFSSPRSVEKMSIIQRLILTSSIPAK